MASQPTTDRVRLGLIGCGYWGPKVLRAAASLPEVQVTALVDQELERARSLERHFPAAAVANRLEAVLDLVDALIIATNPATHSTLAGEAIASGTHVLVEKPLALSVSDCRELELGARDRDVRLMVGHTFRFNPGVQYVRELLDEGALGQIYYIDSQRLNLGRVRGDIDVIWNFAPHDISITNHWVGLAPSNVRCHSYDYLQTGIADIGFLLLQYPTGCIAHIQVSWLSPSKVRRMTVVGSQKMVIYDDMATDKIVVHDSGIDREHLNRSFGQFDSFGEFQLIHRHGDIFMPRLASVEPLVSQCRHFVDCILTGADPITGAADAAGVIAVLEAATASMALEGEEVPVESIQSPSR